VTEETTTAKRGGRKADPLTGILAEVKAELKAIGGLAEFPLGGGAVPTKARRHYRKQAEMWHGINEVREAAGTSGHDGFLLEAAYDVLSHDEPQARADLLKLAALVVGIIESLDGRSE
jgi:hypothetical protein